MKKIILIILGISFYPFGCTAQINGNLPTNCDTVFIEDPKQQEQVLTLTSEVSRLDGEVQSLTQQVVTVQNEVKSKNQQIDVLKISVADLEEALARKPDTIYQDRIVEVIKEVIPENTVDTITLTTCFEDYGDKVWFHAGAVDVYPHRIYFPTKELEIVGVIFTQPLTNDMKKYQLQFKVERTVDHKTGQVMYRNLFIDPSQYMPEL